MMNRFKNMLAGAAMVVAGLLVATASTNAQTLDEVLKKVNDAQGGEDKIRAVKSVYVTGKFIMQGGAMKLDIVQMQQRPKMLRQEISVQNVKGLQVYDGKMAWQTAPWAGIKDPQQMSKEETEEFEENADIDGETIDYKQKGYTLELLGKEDIEGAPAFKIKVTKKNGNSSIQFYDAESYLLVRKTSKRKDKQSGAEIEGETMYSDYRKVDGLTYAFAMENRFNGKVGSQIIVEKMELNKKIDDNLFVMPAPTAETKK